MQDAMKGLDPTRVLVVGDTHHDTSWYLHLLGVAVENGCSVVLSVGDFGYFPRQGYGQEFLAAVEERSSEEGVVNVFVKGNHEDADSLAALEVQPSGFAQVSPSIHYAVAGLRWRWQGVSFAAAGGAVSVDAALRVEGENWWRNETLSYEEVNRLIDDGPVDVLVAHDGPEETMGGAFHKSDLQSQGHRRTISALMEVLAPKLLLHGHYHHGYEEVVHHPGGTTKVAGLGMNEDATTDSGRGYTVLTLPQLLS